jgi:hypothetical protein
MLLGVPGRVTPAPLQLHGTLEAISCYNTEPLRETLERLMEFDRINSGTVRLSVGTLTWHTPCSTPAGFSMNTARPAFAYLT